MTSPGTTPPSKLEHAVVGFVDEPAMMIARDEIRVGHEPKLLVDEDGVIGALPDLASELQPPQQDAERIVHDGDGERERAGHDAESVIDQDRAVLFQFKLAQQHLQFLELDSRKHSLPGSVTILSPFRYHDRSI